MRYMVIWIANAGRGDITRSEPLPDYYAAIDRAKTGPSGAMFVIWNIEDKDNYREWTRGYVS